MSVFQVTTTFRGTDAQNNNATLVDVLSSYNTTDTITNEFDLTSYSIQRILNQLDKLGMTPLPLDTFKHSKGRSISYNKDGYPESTKKASISHCLSPYHASISLEIDFNRVMRGFGHSSQVLVKYKSQRVIYYRPKVLIIIKIYDQKGKKVQSYQHRHKSKAIIKVIENQIVSIGKIEKTVSYAFDNTTTIRQVIDEAIKKINF